MSHWFHCCTKVFPSCWFLTSLVCFLWCYMSRAVILLLSVKYKAGFKNAWQIFRRWLSLIVVTLECCLSVAWMLLECYLSVTWVLLWWCLSRRDLLERHCTWEVWRLLSDTVCYWMCFLIYWRFICGLSDMEIMKVQWMKLDLIGVWLLKHSWSYIFIVAFIIFHCTLFSLSNKQQQLSQSTFLEFFFHFRSSWNYFVAAFLSAWIGCIVNLYF